MHAIRLKFGVLLCSMIFQFTTVGSGFAQQTSYSTSAEYKSMLGEVSKPDARPTKLGRGLLSKVDATNVAVRTQETKSGFELETEMWTLRLSHPEFSLELRNKQTAAAWKIAAQGMMWTNNDGTAVAALESLGKPKSEGNRWIFPMKLQHVADEGTLTISVSSKNIVHIEVSTPLGLKSSHLRWNWQGGGPFFGLGERFAEEKVDGIETTLRPEDLFGAKGHNWTYIPVPLLYTPNGLGLFLDTGEVTRFDLTHAAQGSFSIQMDRSSADLYLFADAGPKEILEAYTSLTGTTPLSPPWAFGVWLCSYGAPDIVLRTAERLRSNRIPSSAIWVFDAMGEGDVMGWPLWRTGYYPKMRELTDKLHSMGFKSLTYVHPYLRNTLAPYNLANPMFQMAKEKGFLVHGPSGVPTGPRFEATSDGNIDFTNPAAVDWYQTKIRQILIDNGFDGWMEDYGEWINENDQFANGSKGRDMQNLFSLLYHKTTYEVSKEAKPDVVEFDRSGYAGSQAYTRVIWGGDQFPSWDHDTGLPSVVNAGITAGLVGFAVWGPDIEENGSSKELWMRWVEFGALTPIMRDHPWDNPNGAVNLWFDAETTATFKKYAGLHVSLFPYLYSYAKEAERTGLPILRHPMLEFPDDRKAWDTDAEYLLGEKLLVAPVVSKGAVTRQLYLPAGEWIDYWTGEALEGGKSVTVSAPIERIPLLVRAGSILPFLSPETQTLATDLKARNSVSNAADLIWRVFPGLNRTNASFTTYNNITADAESDEETIHVRVRNVPTDARQEIVVPASRRPKSVVLDGQTAQELKDGSAGTQTAGWHFDTESHTLQVFPRATNIDLIIQR